MEMQNNSILIDEPTCLFMKYSVLLLFCIAAHFCYSQNNSRHSLKTNDERVEIDASFPGGDGAWSQLIAKNLDANVPLRNNAPSGKYIVIIQFIVNQEGNIIDMQPLSNCGYGMEEEAMRTLQAITEKWIPAMQN